MRILLDHSVPHPLRHFFPDHEVQTTHYRGWHLLQNGALFRKAIQEGYDLLITWCLFSHAPSCLFTKLWDASCSHSRAPCSWGFQVCRPRWQGLAGFPPHRHRKP